MVDIAPPVLQRAALRQLLKHRPGTREALAETLALQRPLPDVQTDVDANGYLFRYQLDRAAQAAEADAAVDVLLPEIVARGITLKQLVRALVGAAPDNLPGSFVLQPGEAGTADIKAINDYNRAAKAHWRHLPVDDTSGADPRLTERVRSRLGLPLRRDAAWMTPIARVISVLVDDVAGSGIAWGPVHARLDLIPPPGARTAADADAPFPAATGTGAQWTPSDVYGSLSSAVQQGILGTELYDALASEGHVHLADRVAWDLLWHPQFYPGRPPAVELPMQVPTESWTGQAGPMQSLPTELLLHIFGRLPLDDLVRCRQVCRRWRAIVATIAEQDRAFSFVCGVSEFLRISQMKEAETLAALDTTDFEYGWLAVTCTCGHPHSLPTAEMLLEVAGGSEAEIAAYGRLPYAARHDVPHPPARWELLRPAHDLALELCALCAQVDPRVPLNVYGSTQWPWMPVFLFVPPSVVRPTTTAELKQLVVVLAEEGRNDPAAFRNIWQQLSTSPEQAAAWYRTPRPCTTISRTIGRHQTPVGWEDAWLSRPASRATIRRVLAVVEEADWDRYGNPFEEVMFEFSGTTCYDHSFPTEADPTGWDRHRYLARTAHAMWSFFAACDTRDLYVDEFNYMDDRLSSFRSDEEIALEIAQHVLAFDRVAQAFKARCRLSVCYYRQVDDYDDNALQRYDDPAKQCMAYFIGLSPDGHLVGACVKSVWEENK